MPSRPAVEVVQEFQQSAAAAVLPSLPAVVVGPGFQVADDVNAGTYSEDNLAVTSYTYTDLTVGAIVDLTEPPEDTFLANAHKAVGFALQDALLIRVPDAPATSNLFGQLNDPNIFTDATLGAFASFDPDADGAPLFYVDIIDAIGIDPADRGRKLVISKTDDNTLVLAAEFASSLPLSNVEYRILEVRAEERYPDDALSSSGITKTATSVDVAPGLETVTDTTPLRVVEGTVLLSYRALRPDLAGKLTVFTDLDSLEAEFGVGSVVPSNLGAFGVNLALQNTTTEVNFVGLTAAYFTNEEQAYQDAFEFLESQDVYHISPLTQNTAVHQQLSSHVQAMSVSTVGRERVGAVQRQLQTVEVKTPASGIGNATSAGTNNGLSGTGNVDFADPDNGQFITDDVGVGDFLEVVSYTAASGVQRSVTPSERDFFSAVPEIQLTNAAFAGTDVNKKILVQGAVGQTAGNSTEYNIDSVTSASRVGVTPTPTAEVMLAATRAVIADFVREADLTTGSNTAVALTNTVTFANETFTAADVGRLIFFEATDSDTNNGIYRIATVESATEVTLVEPIADETFAVTVTARLFDLNREPARDILADAVDGPSRQFTIYSGAFTADDVGRNLDLTGNAGIAAGNATAHEIEAVLSSTVVRVTSGTTPVTEEFNGLAFPTLTVLDVVSTTPNATEDAFITGTRHEIAAIVSETALTLGSDPTAGFGGTLSDVEYRITKDLSLAEQAAFVAGYGASFGTRRIHSLWPDEVAISINGVATLVPGYFAGPVIGGLTAGLPSQQGFTNLSITGFVGRANSDDVFSDTQLDTMANGGTFIFIQPVAGGALQVRHQLTTDVSTIFFQEYSVTKNVDLVARFMRNYFSPYLGIYNITDGLFDLLKTRGEGGLEFLKEQRVARIGAPLRGGSLTRIEESSIAPDSIEIDFDITIPLPLNNIKITLLI